MLFPSIDSANPSEVMAALRQYNCTALTGSPAFAEKIALHAQKNKTTLPVKYVGVGGAPVFRGTLRTLCSVTPDKKVAVIYGSTEAEPISMIFAAEKMKLELSNPDGLCVGKPVFEGSVKVIQAVEGEEELVREI